MAREMNTVALIGCSKMKAGEACAAEQLYQPSTLFRASLAYARMLAPEVLIVSALYGVVQLGDVLAPYEATLTGQSPEYLALWGAVVGAQLRTLAPAPARLIFLAGRAYIDPVRPHLACYQLEEPMRGLGMGKRRAFLAQMPLRGCT